MRVKNSIKNMFFGISSQLLSIIMAFITRTIFIYVLGSDYLGIEGLFSNILSMLSLANLGLESAIIFSLYKPLSENNEIEIKGYMTLYQKVYKFVGLFILISGLLLTPFLHFFINGEININENITLIYLMFLLNSSISYLYIYKQSILIANQQNHYISKIHTYFIIISNVLQISILTVFKKYIPVLAIQLICRMIENIVISKIADSKFPYLKDKNIDGYLSKQQKKKLYKDVYSMLLYKISGTVINSTDNIIISYFVGVIYVGIYSNYLLLISTVRTLTGYIFSSLTASVGNLIVSDENEKKEFIFEEILFISFWIYGFCSISFYILFNDFITLWIGKEYLLNSITVFIIIVNFYTTGMQNAATMYRDTTGLFSIGKYRPIIATILNIGISIILAPKLGISGVLLGTIISRMLVYFWFDPYVIYKNIFLKSSKIYFIKYFTYAYIVAFSGIITSTILNVIKIYYKINGFISSIIVCMIIPNLIFFFLYRKSKYFNYIKSIIISLVKKK